MSDRDVVWLEAGELDAAAAARVKPASSALDIGCGIRPQSLVLPDFLVCIEPHAEYAAILKANLERSRAIVIPLDAMTALKAFPSKSVDAAFLLDVIEHMPKPIGKEVLAELERVVRQQIIVFTPLGFMPQEIHAGDTDGWNLGGGLWQQHLSGWYPDDFSGWSVLACRDYHRQDHQGRALPTPYGSFYAIKEIAPVADCFNVTRAEEIIESATRSVRGLHPALGPYLAAAASSEAARRELCAAVEASRHGVVDFIEQGKRIEHAEILRRIAEVRTSISAREALKFEKAVDSLAEALKSLDARAKELETQIEQQAQDASALEKLRAENDVERRNAERVLAGIEEEQTKLALYRADIARQADVRSKEIEARAQELAAWETRLRVANQDLSAAVERFNASRMVRVWRHVSTFLRDQK